MLTALSYTSDDEFETDYLKHLINEAAELASQRTWWHQPFALAPDPKNEYMLAGSTQLMRRIITAPDGQVRKVDYRDDILLGAVDTLALFEMLTTLSAEHEFTWNILLPSDPRPKHVGRIIGDKIEPKLFELIMPELEALEITESELEDTTLHQKIRSKHLPT